MVLLIIIPMKNGYFIGNINPTFSDKPIYIYIPLIGYIPNYSHLIIIGIMIINHWVIGYTSFRQTHLMNPPSDLKTSAEIWEIWTASSCALKGPLTGKWYLSWSDLMVKSSAALLNARRATTIPPTQVQCAMI